MRLLAVLALLCLPALACAQSAEARARAALALGQSRPVLPEQGCCSGGWTWEVDASKPGGGYWWKWAPQAPAPSPGVAVTRPPRAFFPLPRATAPFVRAGGGGC